VAMAEAPPARGGTEWLVFIVVILGLLSFDMLCLARAEMTVRMAMAQTGFWFVVGLAFNLLVYALDGPDVAVVWFDGYILEYMLSVDNVFFFHVVFKAYSTPESQTYKALYFGVVGAALLRLVFYFVGSEFFRLAWVVQVFFGLVLLYTAYKTVASDDEEDEDPRENRMVKLMVKYLPFSDSYDDAGKLIVKEETENGVATRGTMLLQVVCVLQVVDLIFAVDSVTAKISEYDDIFVNFSSSAFAMLCLRSCYYIVAYFITIFKLLKYGVGVILAFIGVKLIVGKWVELPATLSCAVIVLIFAVSIAASVYYARTHPEEGDNDYDPTKRESKDPPQTSGLPAHADEDDGLELAPHAVVVGAV